jgi:DNA-directed RNA polymerase subunit beta
MTEVAVSSERKNFSKIRSFMDLPNLIDVQRRSYERFLQMNLLPEEREESGLQAVFTSVFPFTDFRGACELQFVRYAIGNWECRCGRLKGLEHLRMECRHCGKRIVTAHPHDEVVSCPNCGMQNVNRVTLCDVCGNPVGLQMKYSVAECQERGMTYSVPLKVTFRLFVYDKDPETGVKTMRDAKEEEVFFGDIPLMTEHGTFVINGTERVIVSQLHRSPGVFFTRESAHGFLAKIIPYRGSWVEFEYDQKGILFVRIDRKRKFPASIFLRALGLETDESILRQFYATISTRFERSRAYLTVGREVLRQEELKERYARVKRETRQVFAGIKLSGDDQKEITKKGAIERSVDDAAVEKACFLGDVVDLATGEVLFEAGQELGPDARSRRSISASPTGTSAGTRWSTRSARTRTRPRTRRFWRSTGACVPETRRPTSRPRTSSRACSSTRRSTTSRAWGASSSTSSSRRIPPRARAPSRPRTSTGWWPTCCA